MDSVELNIEKLNINAEGIGFVNNKKVIVKNVLPDEKIVAEIKSEKQNCIFAKLKKVLEPSLVRIKPTCKYYGECGGCDFQFISQKNALELKKQVLKEYFKDLYSGEIVVNNSENYFNYRNKMSFYVSNKKIGMLCENSKRIVEVDYCQIADNLINDLLKLCKNWVKNNDVLHIVIRAIGGKFILTVVVNNKSICNINNLIDMLKASFEPNSFGVYINTNFNNKQILGDKWQHCFGIKHLQLNLFGLTFQIHPGSFLQVNLPVATKMYEKVCKFVENKVVVEGYSGVGILSAILCKTAKKVFSVEINKNSHQDAEKMKENNNISNLQNINNSCENALPSLAVENKNCVFVLDPSRSGCDTKTLSAIVENNISEIIYISCNPYTLKQNIYLLKNNYKIENFEIFDMFPNTSKIECMTRLVKIK